MHGASRLLSACAAGDLALVERAWDAWDEDERTVDVRGETGRTPLHLASSCGSTAVVQWLLERGAGRDLRDAIGWTALHHAANSGIQPAPNPSTPLATRGPASICRASDVYGTWRSQGAWRRCKPCCRVARCSRFSVFLVQVRGHSLKQHKRFDQC